MKFRLILTASLLIAALIIIPAMAVYGDANYPLNPHQWDTIRLLITLMLGVALSCFVVGEITRNCSQIDKLWSILPAVYAWMVAFAAEQSSRVVLMAVLVTIWAVRLTYNFSRRGGYSWKFWSGEEDYRWEVLRRNPVFKAKWGWGWRLFHLLFIALYQMSLVLLFTLPIVVAWQGQQTPLNGLDALLAVLFIGFVVIETIADQQQWAYQTEKYRRKNNNLPLENYQNGFVDTGLWAKMRHPNYMAEQAIWIIFYLFSVVATGRWVNWSMMGIVLLLLLFQGSADFSEQISREKYPCYQDYLKKVPRFIPRLW